jgi:transposase
MARPMTIEEHKRVAVVDALERHDGNKVKAAKELGVSLKTIYNILARLDRDIGLQFPESVRDKRSE